jgi:hypothetical protein
VRLPTKLRSASMIAAVLVGGFALTATPASAHLAGATQQQTVTGSSTTVTEDVSVKACSWKPGRPYPWHSSQTGYVRAVMKISGCSPSDDWEALLQKKWNGIWDNVDSAKWRGNADQLLQWDCKDGETYTFRAKMKDVESNVWRTSQEITFRCQAP